MKLKYYISSIALLALVASSCQKTEFTELMEEKAFQEESRLASDGSVNPEGSNEVPDPDGIIFIDPVLSDSLGTGVVKEVSDGDEESDDDESDTGS